MPGSHASVFDDPDDFAAALGRDGVVGLLPTGRGQFRARLTRVALHRLRLSFAEEKEPRIAFHIVPAGHILIAFPTVSGQSAVWGGIAVRAGEIVGFGPQQPLHIRAVGPYCWGSILVPSVELCEYGRALGGCELAVPAAARWAPRASVRRLRHFHRAAIRMAEARCSSLADTEAAHGLEQQLIHALVDCLSAGAAECDAPAAGRDLLARFEDELRYRPPQRIADICATLAVSQPMLRACCRQHLGMPPGRYLRLRAQASRRSGSVSDRAPM
jgi:hypothetical protein